MTPQEQTDLSRGLMTAREEAAEQRAKRWQIECLIERGTLILALVAIFYLAGQPKLVPHIVEVDPEGHILWSGPPKSLELSDIQIGTQLKEVIYHSRRRSDDFVLMGEMRTKAEAMTIGKALQAMRAYHEETNPLHKKNDELKKNPIRVKIEREQVRLTRRSAKLWDAEWKEIWTPTYGVGSRTLRVSGSFEVVLLQTPGPFGRLYRKIAEINRSPLGVFVTDYELSEGWEDGN